MKTIVEYLNWIKKVTELDPKLENLSYHRIRTCLSLLDPQEKVGLPSKPTDIEKKLYAGKSNPGELVHFCNMVLDVAASLDEIEKLYAENSFILDERVHNNCPIDKLVGLRYGYGIGAVDIFAKQRVYTHRKNPSLFFRTFHSFDRPYGLRYKAPQGTQTIGMKQMFEKAEDDDADIVINASVWIEGEKKGLVRLAPSLLQDIVDQNIPAIFSDKERQSTLVNLPRKKQNRKFFKL